MIHEVNGWEEDDDDWVDDVEEDVDDPLDEWVMDCGDPTCCMNFAPHYRHECYTPEMYEAAVAAAEAEGSSDPTADKHE